MAYDKKEWSICKENTKEKLIENRVKIEEHINIEENNEELPNNKENIKELTNNEEKNEENWKQSTATISRHSHWKYKYTRRYRHRHRQTCILAHTHTHTQHIHTAHTHTQTHANTHRYTNQLCAHTDHGWEHNNVLRMTDHTKKSKEMATTFWQLDNKFWFLFLFKAWVLHTLWPLMTTVFIIHYPPVPDMAHWAGAKILHLSLLVAACSAAFRVLMSTTPPSDWGSCSRVLTL